MVQDIITLSTHLIKHTVVNNKPVLEIIIISQIENMILIVAAIITAGEVVAAAIAVAVDAEDTPMVADGIITIAVVAEEAITIIEETGIITGMEDMAVGIMADTETKTMVVDMIIKNLIRPIRAI